MFIRMLKPSKGWVQRGTFSPLFHMCMYIVFRCISNRDLLGNRLELTEGKEGLCRGTLGWNWNERRKNVDPLSMPLEMKYTSRNKGSLLIKDPDTYSAVWKWRWHDSTLPEKRYCNLVSLENTLAPRARVGRPEEEQRLLLRQKGLVYRGTRHEGWGTKCAGCVHIRKLEQMNACDTWSGRGGLAWKHSEDALGPCAAMEGLTWQNKSDIKGERDIVRAQRLIQLQSIPGLFR